MKIPKLPLPSWVRDIKSTTTPTGKRKYEVSPGVWYPSVTTILSTADPVKNASIEQWKQSYGRTAADAKVKKATDRGTSVHEYIDSWLDTFDVELNADDHDISIRAPFNQIRRELVSNLTEIWAKEVVLLSHELKVAGRVDLVGRWNGTPTIIDFKTADKKKTEADITSYFQQVTIYSLCWYELTGDFIDDFVILIGSEKMFKPQVFKGKITKYIPSVVRIAREFHNVN